MVADISSRRRRAKVRRLRRAGLGEFCCWCRRPFTANNRPTIEHLTPRRHGGTHDIDNLALAHADCNFLVGQYRARPAT